mgnify:CR=1 FL=1
MKPMRSYIDILYNGVDGTNIIGEDCESFSWVDRASGESDTLTLHLSNTGQKWMNGFFPSDTDVIKAWLRLEEWPVDYREGRIYCGAFMVDSIKYSGWPEKLDLSAISVPINSDFNVKAKSRSWESTTVRSILGDIATAAGIDLVFDAQDHNVESMSQSGKVDSTFAKDLCREYGLAIKLYNNKIVVYDQAVYERAAPVYTITREDMGTAGAYRIDKQITKTYNSVKIQYTDKSGQTLSYEYTIPDTDGQRQKFISSKADSLRDAEIKAKAALRESLRSSRTLTITKTGSAKHVAAQVFQLEGFGRLDGNYFIDSVTHNRSAGKYTCVISAHLAVTAF